MNVPAGRAIPSAMPQDRSVEEQNAQAPRPTETPPRDASGLAGQVVERIVLRACSHYRAVLAAFTILFALAVWAATGLKVDTDSSRMIDVNLSFQQRELALNAAFPLLGETIAVVVRSETPDAADAALDALATRLTGDPSVADVFAPTIDPFFRAHGLLYLPEEDFQTRLASLERMAPFLGALAAEPSLGTMFTALEAFEARGSAGLDPILGTLADTLQDALADRPAAFSWSAMESDAGSVQRVLQVRPVPDFTNLQPVQATMDAIADAVAALDLELARLIDVGVTGDPALRHEELDSVSRGIGLALGGSFVIVAVLLFIAYGSVARTGATLLALVVSLVLVTGGAALTLDALNLVSVAFVVLLVGLGLDFTIHTLLHVDAEGPPKGRAADIARIGHEIGGALVLGALTSALAFLAFVPTRFDGIAQLGILGAAGVVIALVVSITFVPALVMAFPRLAKGRPVRSPSVSRAPSRGRHPWVVGVLIVLVPAAVLLGRDARFDADPNVLRDPGSPSMLALAWLHDDPETQPYRVSVTTRTAADAASLARALDALPEVASASTIDDFIPSAQPVKLARLDRVREILLGIASGQGPPLPERAAEDAARSLAARLASKDGAEADALRGALLAWIEANEEARDRAERAVFRFFPPLIDTLERQATAGPVEIADLPKAITTRFLVGDIWRIEILPAEDPRDQATLEAFVEAVETRVSAVETATLAGPPVQILLSGKTVAEAIVQAVAVAGFATLLVCYIMLRDWRLVLAIIIPLIAAAAFAAAAAATLGIAFNYANVIVLPLIVGLGVDSGIHLALRHRSVRDTGQLFRTNTPRAVVFSGLTTIAAFGSLALSDHQGTASMGIMLAVAVFLTLATTLIWTPALCELFDRKVHARPA
ncbi:MAG: MMPL family transporter [Pseudomonadota bacterium]